MTASAALSDVLHSEWYHNSLQAWVIAALTASLLSLALLLIRRLAASHLGALAEKTTNLVDDMVVALIRETRAWVIVSLAVYLGTKSLALLRIDPYFVPACKLVFLWQVAVWGAAAVTFWVKH